MNDWYYFSFAKPKFAGAIWVQGRSLEDAHNNAVRLGADPNWHAVGINTSAMDAPLPNEVYLNRLLSKEELEASCEDSGGLQEVGVCTKCADEAPVRELK